MKKQTILVVDDDREIVRAISKLLELEGYETLKAVSYTHLDVYKRQVLFCFFAFRLEWILHRE